MQPWDPNHYRNQTTNIPTGPSGLTRLSAEILRTSMLAFLKDGLTAGTLA